MGPLLTQPKPRKRFKEGGFPEMRDAIKLKSGVNGTQTTAIAVNDNYQENYPKTIYRTWTIDHIKENPVLGILVHFLAMTDLDHARETFYNHPESIPKSTFTLKYCKGFLSLANETYECTLYIVHSSGLLKFGVEIVDADNPKHGQAISFEAYATYFHVLCEDAAYIVNRSNRQNGAFSVFVSGALLQQDMLDKLDKRSTRYLPTICVIGTDTQTIELSNRSNISFGQKVLEFMAIQITNSATTVEDYDSFTVDVSPEFWEIYAEIERRLNPHASDKIQETHFEDPKGYFPELWGDKSFDELLEILYDLDDFRQLIDYSLSELSELSVKHETLKGRKKAQACMRDLKVEKKRLNDFYQDRAEMHFEDIRRAVDVLSEAGRLFGGFPINDRAFLVDEIEETAGSAAPKSREDKPSPTDALTRSKKGGAAGKKRIQEKTVRVVTGLTDLVNEAVARVSNERMETIGLVIDTKLRENPEIQTAMDEIELERAEAKIKALRAKRAPKP